MGQELDDTLGDKHNLTSLLIMSAHSPCTETEFVSLRLSMNHSSYDDVCWYCIGELEAEERGDTDFENFVEECTCAPEDLDQEEWEDYQYELID